MNGQDKQAYTFAGYFYVGLCPSCAGKVGMVEDRTTDIVAVATHIMAWIGEGLTIVRGKAGALSSARCSCGRTTWAR